LAPVSVSISTLRALAGEKRFAIEPSRIFRRRFRLVDLDIGHAVMRPASRCPTFTLKEAVVYLRHVERGEERA
jgi:hypothetical protein